MLSGSVNAATSSTTIFNNLYTQIAGSGVDGYIITPYQASQCVFSSTQPSISVVGHKLLPSDNFAVDFVGSGIAAWCKSEATVVGGNFITLTPASDAAINGNGSVNVDQAVNLSKVGGLPTSLGQKVMASSIPVTLSSNQSSIPVSGTISGTVSATQSGTWTVQPGNTANTTAWKVDGSAVTQPISGAVTANAGTGTFLVSAASLPLPSGASTAAKQPAIGTAGTPSADVITVQGATSMTAFKVDGSAVTQPVSAASLPLPSGAATSANQSTEISSLSTVVTNTAAGVARTLTPPTASSGAVTPVDSTSYESSHVISASSATLLGCMGYNSKASTQYILFFNSATVPADATAPTISAIAVGASSSFAVDFGVYGRPFSTGIAVSNSSTANTKTIGSADVWFSCRIK